ncbi:MAG: hypothetical protein U5J97_10470 [Trueperaceae bacterium]|nr:hypothetical protein [Trueperaceae bacterium]
MNASNSPCPRAFEVAERGSGNVDVTVRVRGDASGEVVRGGAELAGPADVAVLVVRANERIVVAGVAAFEGAERMAGNVDVTVRVRGDASGEVVRGGAELAGPAEIAVLVVRANERVGESSVGAFEGAARGAGNVDVAVRVRRDTVGDFERGGAELAGPAEIAVLVVARE